MTKITEFNISREKSEAFFQSGRKAAEKFFENWDFDTYVKNTGETQLSLDSVNISKIGGRKCLLTGAPKY